MELIDEEIFEGEIVALEKKASKHENSKNLIAFYGSSSIRLWDTMENDLNPLNVINLGFGGSSFPFCLHYFDRVFESISPSQVVIYAGDNDLGSGHSSMDVFKNFKRLVESFHKKYVGISIHAISIKPSPSRSHLLHKTSEVNALMKKYILSIKNGKWIETFSKMLDENGNTLPELYIEDQLHLNEKGYDLWRKVVKHHLFANNKVI